MPKLLSSREIISILLAEGFIFISQRGSHIKFRKSILGAVKTVIVPAGRKVVLLGTLRSIIRQSGIPKEKFFDN